MTKVQTITCTKCGDTIYSRTRHDFRSCGCGEVSIDGGFDYVKVCGNPGDFTDGELEVDATKAELYFDWKGRTDTYGLIKAK